MANVLVVDDDRMARQFIQFTLRGSSHKVYEAEDWGTMNQALTQRSFAVLLLDVGLPGIQGDQLADIVRSLVRPCPEIILYSGLKEEKLKPLCQEIGVERYVIKGYSKEAALEIIESAIQSFEASLA